MRIERLLCGGDEGRMIGQAEIIVCAHVEDAFAASDGDVRILWTCDDPLGFEEALRFNFLERLRNLLFEFRKHRWTADYADLNVNKNESGATDLNNENTVVSSV